MGDAEHSYPYLNGSWSVQLGGEGCECIPSMPFDGILVASRMMVAKEACTAPEVKKILIDTPGIPVESEKLWEVSYDGSTDCGGIITVRSELGEPIHKVATRGMRLWREFDTRFFNIPRNDRPAIIEAAKDEIIRRCNADFQKLYFVLLYF